MKFTISTIYASPDCGFEISSKIPKLIAEKVNQRIFPNYQLDTLKPAWTLSLMLATDSDLGKTERKICEVEVFEKDKNENYVAWIPYSAVVNKEKSQLENYLKEVFEVLSVVLANYQVDMKDLISIKTEVQNLVMDNPNYAFKSKFKPNLNAILERVNDKHKVGM
ncbi:MAG: hypothetical protein EAZ08_00720 [Cytophagales bacterium]|nr:MAG: hypothetical protein EAZ08_00720 [Cytophagales bacterium]